MTKEIAVPDEKKLAEQENKALEIARAMVITDDAGVIIADNFCAKLKALEKMIVNDFAESKAAANAAHRAITAQESSHLARVIEPRSIVVKKIRSFREEQEAARQAEEKRLQAIEDKRAEYAALEAAYKAEKSGDKDMAEAILAAPVVAAPVIVERTAPKLQTRIADTWTYTAIPIERMTNQQLINARAYLTWDTLRLGQQARSTHDTIKVDGVTFRIKK
jgi:altronate dehydratase